MGSDFAKPNAKNILNPILFLEYTDTKLADLKECSTYLSVLNKPYLNQSDFEDTFGLLFMELDPHFAAFEISAIETQIPASMREDIRQPLGTVDPLVVCTLIALLSKDSVEKKFVYLYELNFSDNNKKLEVRNMNRLLYRTFEILTYDDCVLFSKTSKGSLTLLSMGY